MLKVASTLCVRWARRVQVGRVALQAPDHPVNSQPRVACASSRTWRPGCRRRRQCDVQCSLWSKATMPGPLMVIRSVAVGCEAAGDTALRAAADAKKTGSNRARMVASA